jgi:hypothetical protein
MIRHMLAIFVLVRLCTSLALILLEGASSLLEAAAFMIALIGLALVSLVISGMASSGRAAPRGLGERSRRLVTAR